MASPALSPAAPGRRTKDDSLRLRDRYWAISLKARLPNESYASIERNIYKGITVSKREFGQGYSQPFAMSNVAGGRRGISSDPDGVPAPVAQAETLWPGSAAPYRLLLWKALAKDGWLRLRRGCTQEVDFAVQRRLRRGDLLHEGLSAGSLSAAGITRLGRLTHPVALALLLASGSCRQGVDQPAFLADLYATPVFARLCRTDTAFSALSEEIRCLVDIRYPGVLRLDQPGACAAFNSRSDRAWALVPF